MEVFQNYNFHSNFNTGTTTISCFLWCDMFTWIIFEKTSAKYPKLNNHNLSILLSNNSVPWKKQLCTQLKQPHKCFFLNNHPSVYREVFFVCFPFVIQNIKDLAKCWEYSKMNNFSCFIKDILSESVFLCVCICMNAW